MEEKLIKRVFPWKQKGKHNTQQSKKTLHRHKKSKPANG